MIYNTQPSQYKLNKKRREKLLWRDQVIFIACAIALYAVLIVSLIWWIL